MREHPYQHPRKKESGSVMIFVLFIMMIVTIIGISATSSSTFEGLIATNDQHYRIAFYNSESGIFGVPKMISLIINENGAIPIGGSSDAAGVMYLQSTNHIGDAENEIAGNLLYDQLAGYTAYDDMNRDIGFSEASTIAADIDIERNGAFHLAGSGVEFATGYEGVGPGSVGGVGLFFDMDSLGRSSWRQESNRIQGSATVRATYRKVLGIAGGL